VGKVVRNPFFYGRTSQKNFAWMATCQYHDWEATETNQTLLSQLLFWTSAQQTGLKRAAFDPRGFRKTPFMCEVTPIFFLCFATLSSLIDRVLTCK